MPNHLRNLSAILSLLQLTQAQILPQQFYETNFMPTSSVVSVSFDVRTLSWAIVTRYSAASTFPADLVAIPIMYFPTPGNTLLSPSTNPCILDRSGLCCLLDFSILYTTVALYDWMKTSGLTIDTCNNASFYTESMRNLHNTSAKFTTDTYVTGALRRFPNASVTQLVSASQADRLGYHLAQAIVDYR